MNFVSRNKPEQDGLGDSGVRSVEAALRILEMLAECIGPARVTDIAQQLSLGKPRVCRHLATLEAMGLARKVGRQGYVFGDRLTHIAHHVLRERTVGEIARPALEALRDDTGQTVTWSVPSGEGAVVAPGAAMRIGVSGVLERSPGRGKYVLVWTWSGRTFSGRSSRRISSFSASTKSKSSE